MMSLLTYLIFYFIGPLFAPPYERLPQTVNFYYNSKKLVLSDESEEIATFDGQMLDHDYTTKEVKFFE